MAKRQRHGARVIEAPTPNQSFDSLHLTAQQYGQEFPGADADSIEVNLAVLRTQRVMSAAIGRYLVSLGLASGMTGARYNLMRTLYFARDRQLAQNELGKEMGVSRTNITNLIDGLERDGLVERIASQIDRRVSFAQLTSEGERLLKKLMPAMVGFMQEACAGFTSDEKRRFAAFLHRFRSGLESTYPGDAPPADDAGG